MYKSDTWKIPKCQHDSKVGEKKKKKCFSCNMLPQTKLIILLQQNEEPGAYYYSSCNYSNNNTGVLTERLLCARHCAKDSRTLLYLNLVIIFFSTVHACHCPSIFTVLQRRGTNHKGPGCNSASLKEAWPCS